MNFSGELPKLIAYARTSTADQQNPKESLRWQLDAARTLTAGRAEIIDVVHDQDTSRSVPWSQRREASDLLRQLGNPARGWTGIVVGELQRAFGDRVIPVLNDWLTDVSAKKADEILAEILRQASADPSEPPELRIARRVARDAQAKLERYLTAIDKEMDPSLYVERSRVAQQELASAQEVIRTAAGSQEAPVSEGAYETSWSD